MVLPKIIPLKSNSIPDILKRAITNSHFNSPPMKTCIPAFNSEVRMVLIHPQKGLKQAKIQYKLLLKVVLPQDDHVILKGSTQVFINSRFKESQ